MNINEYLEKALKVEIPSEIAEIINREAFIASFSSGHTVIHEGEITSYLYFIIRGVVRGYYVDDKGNDITKCFSMEGEFFSTEGFRTSSPATFSIECLEDCQCIGLMYGQLHRIIREYPQLGDLVSRSFQFEVGRLEERYKNYMLMDAKERYSVFCQENPNLHGRIALKHIASYIGVRPASLSRIRKNFN